jgi:hypothetical protein
MSVQPFALVATRLFMKAIEKLEWDDPCRWLLIPHCKAGCPIR